MQECHRGKEEDPVGGSEQLDQESLPGMLCRNLEQVLGFAAEGCQRLRNYRHNKSQWDTT